MTHRPINQRIFNRSNAVKSLPLLILLVVTTLLALVIVASPASSANTQRPHRSVASSDPATKPVVAHIAHRPFDQMAVQATATLSPTADQATSATLPQSTPTPADCWSTTIPAGAIAGQPAPVFCTLANSGPATSSQDTNTWQDEFEHGLSLGNFTGDGYRIFERLGVHQSLHWRHANHWMVDIAPDAPAQSGANNAIGGAMVRPERTFRFQEGLLRVDTDYAAGIPAYSATAWGEIIITTGDHPVYQGNSAGEALRSDTLYGYDMFPNHWTLGCRLQADSHTTCTLMTNNTLGPNDGGRSWEISFFQLVGDSVIGGFSDGSFYRFCQAGDPDSQCRDRFRLEVTRTSLTIYANGVKYFEQTGLPPLPDELVNGDVYIYLASIVNQAHPDTVRFHWDHFLVNNPAPPTAAPGFGERAAANQVYLPVVTDTD